MKSDFKRFMFLRRMAIASVVLAASLLFGGCLCYTLCNGGLVAFTLAIVGFLSFSVTGAVLMAAAYDNLICPRCGQRAVEIKRNLADKENHRRYRAVLNDEPMKCACCGAEIKTA